MTMRRAAIRLVILALAVGIAAWFFLLRHRPSDEEQIYRLVAEAAQAVEAKSPAGVLKLISENYQDPYGNNKRALAQQVIAGLRTVDRYTVVPEIASLRIEGRTATAQVKARVWFGERSSSPGTDLSITLHLAKEGRHWLATSAEGWAAAEEAYMNR
jgi:hypothetical protein